MSLRSILVSITLIVAATMGSTFVTAAPAMAAAYTQGVYAPSSVGGNVEGWANVSTNCEGTFGCSAYVKVEYLDDNPVRPPWFDGWAHIGGQWATGGWNKVAASSHGCGTYRMVVDTYNDAVGDAVFGINLGIVEFNLGGGVKRYHQTAASPAVRLCPIV